MKKVLIFGTSSDIGNEIAKKLKGGYEVYGTRFKGEPNVNISEEYVCDITSLEEIDKVYSNVGGLDAIIFSCMPELLSPVTDFEGYLKAEKFLEGHVYALTEGIKKLNKGGKIITISGSSADMGLPAAPYMGANFAYLSNLTKSSNAINGRKSKFSMYDLQVGPVDTKMWERVPLKPKEDWETNSKGFISPEIVADYARQILKYDIAPTKIVIDNFYNLPGKGLD
ncbi:MAG: SDR family oxidoreductase [Candidatus Pacearchaeota archaeon]